MVDGEKIRCATIKTEKVRTVLLDVLQAVEGLRAAEAKLVLDTCHELIDDSSIVPVLVKEVDSASRECTE